MWPWPLFDLDLELTFTLNRPWPTNDLDIELTFTYNGP